MSGMDVIVSIACNPATGSTHLHHIPLYPCLPDKRKSSTFASQMYRQEIFDALKIILSSEVYTSQLD